MKPVTISPESCSDISVEVKHGDSSLSEKDYETLPCMSSVGEETIYANQSCEDINTEESKNFHESCMHELMESNLLRNLIAKLDESNNLKDFMTLLRHLASGAIPMDNIVLLLILERAKFQSCKNTISMRYRKVTKVFWSIVYQLCKSAGLKFFSGEKNWGQVITKSCTRSNYSPDKSKINFAVPSESVLRHFDVTLPKIIPPGKINKCLDLLQGEQDIVLMADGKLVTKGL